jgi:hypothetical protein
MPKETFSTLNITTSILVIAGAAVNSGELTFYFAIPFMAYIIYKGFKSKKIYGLVALLYALGAIGTSVTRDSNPLLYPILDNGLMEVQISEGFIFYDNFRKIFTREELQERYASNNELMQFLNNPNPTSNEISLTFNWSGIDFPQKIRKVKQGDTFEVIAINHDYQALQDNISVVTELGSFSKAKTHSFNKDLQSKWSNALENFTHPLIFPWLYLIMYAIAYAWSKRSKLLNTLENNN